MQFYSVLYNMQIYMKYKETHKKSRLHSIVYSLILLIKSMLFNRIIFIALNVIIVIEIMAIDATIETSNNSTIYYLLSTKFSNCL